MGNCLDFRICFASRAAACRGPAAMGRPILPQHGVRRCETPDTYHWLWRQRLDAGDKAFLRAFLAEARGFRAILPSAMGEIPKVRQLGMHLNAIAQLGVGKAMLAYHLVEVV